MESAVADLQRSHGKYIYHGTDVHVVEAIVSQGLLLGGGEGASRTTLWSVPCRRSGQRPGASGGAATQDAVVQCSLEVLLRAGVRLFSGADGVLLADTVPTSAIFRILAADNQRGECTEVLAEIGVAPPTATLAASSEEAPVVPDAEAGGGVPRGPAPAGGVSGADELRPVPSGLPGGLVPSLEREGHFFEMTEANRSRSARKLEENVVVPLLVKGDKIKLKDGTRLFYGEGFDTESEPEVNVPAASTGPIPSYGGGRRGMEMRDDPDEQEQIRRLRERGSLERAGRGCRVHGGAASTEGAQPAADPPGQPIVFRSGQFYRWGSWVCYFCDGVNPPKQTTASTSRLVALTWAPGVAGIGRPVPGARTTTSAPEEWRNCWEADRLRDYEDNIPYSACQDDDRIAEAFTSRMREIAEPKEAKAERKRAAMAAIQASSLLVGGWLCPGCEEWNLSFRNLCYKRNGRRTAAGVLSRGVPDPRRNDQDRDESDSDDSAALDVRQEEQEELEATLKPFLRSTRSKKGPGSKKRGNPYGGTQGGGSKGKYSKGRGTRGGAAAWLGVGVVALAWCAVLSPSACRRGPYQFAAVRRDHFGRVTEPVREAASYTWALARRVLNRLAHLSVQRGSVGVVDETLAAVAQQSAELVQEVGAEAARTVQVAGRAFSVITLILCAAATWFVERAVLNRLVHALKGNSLPATLVELVGGEATFAVKGKRSQVMHKVWVRLDSKQSACGCKAYLQEGACGHCDAAVQAAVQMGLVRPDLAAAASEGDRPAELGSRVIAKGLAALPTQECFSGLAAKSREISCLSGLLNCGGSSPGAPAATSTALAVPAPAAATAAQGPRRNKTPRAEPPSRAVQEAAYLAGGSYVAAGLSVLAKTRSRDRVFLRAYSFDAPRLGGARGGVRTRSGMQLGRRRFPTRQDQASVAVAKARGRRRGERPSRGGSLRARRVRGGRPRHYCGSGPERAAPREGSAGRRRDDSRPHRRQPELVDEL
ncbi:unnamed protein product [Symbiodinium microadriaticum]|nr:unnamed protein product [Symbiodinium microadriaticum]